MPGKVQYRDIQNKNVSLLRSPYVLAAVTITDPGLPLNCKKLGWVGQGGGGFNAGDPSNTKIVISTKMTQCRSERGRRTKNRNSPLGPLATAPFPIGVVVLQRKVQTPAYG